MKYIVTGIGWNGDVVSEKETGTQSFAYADAGILLNDPLVKEVRITKKEDDE